MAKALDRLADAANNGCCQSRRPAAQAVSMTVTLRSACLPEDTALLLDLNTEYLEFVFAGACARFDVALAEVFPAGDIRAYLAEALPKTLGPGPPASCFYILERDGQPIGMGGVRRVRDGVCEMKRVYVRDGAKGQGLGRHLVERLIEDGRNFGYRSMFIDTSPTLETAIGLYERLGFTRIPAYPEVEVPEIMFPHWVFMARDI